MAGNDKRRHLSELRRQLQRELTIGRASCKGDPDALRDHQDRVAGLRAEIRSLER